MSNDPYINAALFNFCHRLDDGPRNTSDVPREPRSMEDLQWLRQALAAIESPDKILKQQLQILEISMGWDSLGGGKRGDEADKKSGPADNKKEEPKPTGLKLLANGTNPVGLNDVLNSLEWLVEELEDINMATEMCLMNGPAILLNLLQVTAANFVAPPTSAAAAAAITTAPTAPVPRKPHSKFSVFESVNCVLKAPVVADLARDSEVRTAVAKAIAHATQQNPKVQEAFAVHNWATIVVPVLAFEVERYIYGFPSATSSSAAPVGPVTGNTVAALLHLCSCMCRENDEGTKDFIAANGLAILDELIASPARVSAKILKRALFFIEYLASIGISNKGIIQHTANVVMLTGSHQTVRITSSSSSSAGDANDAVANPTDESALSADVDGKNDAQRAAAAALYATYEKGLGVVTDILKPMGLGSYLAKALPLANVEREDVRWQLAKVLEG